MSTSYLPTGPVVVKAAPSAVEATCMEDFFEICPANVNNNHLTKPIRAVGYTLLAVNVVLAGYFLFWVYVNRNERIVKASQPEFLMVICAGCIIMTSSIVTMSLDDGVLEEDGGCVGCTCEGCDSACMASPWLAALVSTCAPLLLQFYLFDCGPNLIVLFG